MSYEGGSPAIISVQSRECSPELLERLSGSTLFPERPVGAAIVAVVRRQQGTLFYVTAPAMVDADAQVEYFLGLLPEEPDARPGEHRERVTIGSLSDDSARWLSEKLLDPQTSASAELRRSLTEFVRHHRNAGTPVSLSYFEPSGNLERLAAELELPRDQADASHIPLGTKAAGRRLFQSAGIDIADGTEECHSSDDLANEVADFLRRGHRRFVLKLSSTEYGAGMGNALLDLSDLDLDSADLNSAVHDRLAGAELVDGKLTWADYARMIERSGVLAEELIQGDEVRSPSFQGRLDGNGAASAVSTHDQVLGGAGLTYVGSSFPANDGYREQVIDYGLRVGRALAAEGVRGGDYGVDFLAVRSGTRWRLVGCELNLRATGTKHGFAMATALLDRLPDDTGRLFLVDGSERVYQASDAITDPHLLGMSPRHMIHAIQTSDLGYSHRTGTGVVLHMLSALPAYGKFGAVCVATTKADAARMMAELHDLAIAAAREQVIAHSTA
jgi:hypothetical protein